MDKELQEYLVGEIKEQVHRARQWEDVLSAMGVTFVDFDMLEGEYGG